MALRYMTIGLVAFAIGAAHAHEALVEKSTGKIEVVKPDGSVWGAKETNAPGSYYTVKRIQDDSLPEEGVLVWPYCVTTNVACTHIVDGVTLVVTCAFDQIMDLC